MQNSQPFGLAVFTNFPWYARPKTSKVALILAIVCAVVSLGLLYAISNMALPVLLLKQLEIGLIVFSSLTVVFAISRLVFQALGTIRIIAHELFELCANEPKLAATHKRLAEIFIEHSYLAKWAIGILHERSENGESALAAAIANNDATSAAFLTQKGARVKHDASAMREVKKVTDLVLLQQLHDAGLPLSCYPTVRSAMEQKLPELAMMLMDMGLKLEGAGLSYEGGYSYLKEAVMLKHMALVEKIADSGYDYAGEARASMTEAFKRSDTPEMIYYLKSKGIAYPGLYELINSSRAIRGLPEEWQMPRAAIFWLLENSDEPFADDSRYIGNLCMSRNDLDLIEPILNKGYQLREEELLVFGEYVIGQGSIVFLQKALNAGLTPHLGSERAVPTWAGRKIEPSTILSLALGSYYKAVADQAEPSEQKARGHIVKMLALQLQDAKALHRFGEQTRDRLMKFSLLHGDATLLRHLGTQAKMDFCGAIGFTQDDPGLSRFNMPLVGNKYPNAIYLLFKGFMMAKESDDSSEMQRLKLMIIELVDQVKTQRQFQTLINYYALAKRTDDRDLKEVIKDKYLELEMKKERARHKSLYEEQLKAEQKNPPAAATGGTSDARGRTDTAASKDDEEESRRATRPTPQRVKNMKKSRSFGEGWGLPGFHR